MILVDTSIWIELLDGKVRKRSWSEDILRFATCGLIIQEVLQGVRDEGAGKQFREAFLDLPRLCDPTPAETFLEAAEIYRIGRRKGYTIRSSADCLIASIAIRSKVPLWHRDRDFKSISRFTSLDIIEQL